MILPYMDLCRALWGTSYPSPFLPPSKSVLNPSKKVFYHSPMPIVNLPTDKTRLSKTMLA